MTVPDAKWIRFELLPRQPDRKTDTWVVVAKDGDDRLGEVRWFGRWRQYSFFPTLDGESVFERQCLRDIANFLERKTTDHRVNRGAS